MGNTDNTDERLGWHDDNTDGHSHGGPGARGRGCDLAHALDRLGLTGETERASIESFIEREPDIRWSLEHTHVDPDARGVLDLGRLGRRSRSRGEGGGARAARRPPAAGDDAVLRLND